MAKENLNTVRADLIAKGVLHGDPVRSNFHGRAVNKGVSQLNAILARRASFHTVPNKQAGSTLPEFLILLYIIFWLSVVGGGLYALVHFIAKFW